MYNERLTEDNKQFLDEMVQDKYGSFSGTKLSPLKIDPIEPTVEVEWQKHGMKRTGLIAKKIGVYPLWLKNGKKVFSTLLQVNTALIINKQHQYHFNFNIPIYFATIFSML